MFRIAKKKKMSFSTEAKEKKKLSTKRRDTKVNRSLLLQIYGFRLGSMLFSSQFRVRFWVFNRFGFMDLY